MAAPSPVAQNFWSSRPTKISADGNFRHTAFLAESVWTHSIMPSLKDFRAQSRDRARSMCPGRWNQNG